MKKKRIISLLLGALLVAGLIFVLPAGVSGCGEETLKIGYTLYEPMNYIDSMGNLSGHDTEFAEMACEEMGYKPEFVRIDWNKKELALASGEIDLIWNGMTITDDLREVMLISDPYMVNQQVVVAKKNAISAYVTTEDLAEAETIAYEKGSAAESVLEDVFGSLEGSRFKGAQSQKDAFTEVYSGASEIAIVDITMANTMLAEGTDFSSTLAYADVGFPPEEYGIGMRDDEQGRELLASLNAIIAKYKEDGTFDALYEKYIANPVPSGITFGGVTLSLLGGFGVTCLIFIVTLGCALPLGLLISFGTMSRFKWLRGILKTIIWIIRGVPLMLLVITIYYVPGILLGTVAFPALVAVFIAFVINYACYFSEIFRGGIQSISRGQYEAGQALGMTKAQIFFRIVLVQVIKRIIPPMSNEIITLVKDTALARVILVEEIILRAEDFIVKGFIWPLFYSAVFYLVFVGILTLLFRYAEKKLSYFKV